MNLTDEMIEVAQEEYNTLTPEEQLDMTFMEFLFEVEIEMGY